LVSLNPYAIAIDENRRDGGTGGERKRQWSTSSNPHAMAKDGASEKEQHIREHKHPNPLIGCLDPRALNGTETPLGS
jgi:hypothetical protein